jgi:hypothetical protein
MHHVLMFGVMLISPMPCLFVLLRVDEQAIEEPGTQQVETLQETPKFSWAKNPRK